MRHSISHMGLVSEYRAVNIGQEGLLKLLFQTLCNSQKVNFDLSVQRLLLQ